MRGLGLFFGGPARRNDPVKLTDPHPIADYGTKDLCSGDAGKDGYSVLSQASPTAQGNPPFVKGAEGFVYQGPDSSFEQ
jgi:hypothetical protein